MQIQGREMRTHPNHLSSRFIQAAGMMWHVQQAGSGPTLLLIHGGASSTHTWRDLLPILAAHYTVLAVDLPGHGRSDLASIAQSSILGLSNLLAALLDEMAFTPEIVIGHSAGAVILCNMVFSHQIKPRIIVSINGAFLPRLGAAGLVISQLATRFAWRSVLPRMLAKQAFDRDNVARLIEATGSRLDEAGIDLYAQLLQKPEHVSGAMRLMNRWDLTAFNVQLQLVQQPVALLVAADDKVVPLPHAMAVMRHLKHATLYPLAKLGHLAHEEQPALIGNLILRILAPRAEKRAEALASL